MASQARAGTGARPYAESRAAPGQEDGTYGTHETDGTGANRAS